jgi:glycerophosphoryl diester phosphodiesterase
MTRGSFISLVLLAGALAGFAQRNVDDIRRKFLEVPSGTVLVAAHRAAHKQYPENSLKAITEAIRLGVDIIEIDVKVSKDGVPFLMHDRTMDRTTTGTGDPEELTWAALQQYFIVDKGKRTSLKIPSLEDALKLAEGRIMVDLDLKTDRIGPVINVVKKTATENIVVFFDSDFAMLSRIREAGRDFMIMPRAHSYTQADSALLLFDASVVHIDFSFYTPECTQLIHNNDARVWINALGDVDEDIARGREKRALKKLLQHGADIIQTDEPELMLKILSENGYR